MITIDIEIKPRNRAKEFICHFQDKAEDILFSIITRIPEYLIPSSVMHWLTDYIDKRTQELQQEIVRQQWQKVYLDKALSEIHNMQQDTEKAPQED